ncbi:hypothetical protein, partial [Sinomonas sp.]|uniref:hypothetical protein n=1 Tax=Sinomonas sp. TaxID=1914986 RepID=UPI002FE18A8A
MSKSTSAVQPLRLRRVSRRRETHRDVVLTAVPSGSVRAAHGRQALAALRGRPEWARCTAGRRARLMACLRAVIERADYETMTSRPTWAFLMERVGVSRASVARYLRTLREWGLLGLVASGRTAPYASLPEDGSERTNEAAVYVVCMPAPLAAVDAAASAVDKTETPPALGGSHLKREEDPPHARKEKAQKDAAAPRAPFCGEALAGLARLTASDDRQLTLWPLPRTPATTMSRRAAAAEVRHRAPALGCLSVRDVAAVL